MTVRLIFWFFVGLFLKSTLHLYTPPSVNSKGSISSSAGFTSVFITALSPNTYGSDQSLAWAIFLPRTSMRYIGSLSFSSLYQNTMMTISSLIGGSMSQGIWALKPATAFTSDISTEKYGEATELSLWRRYKGSSYYYIFPYLIYAYI